MPTPQGWERWQRGMLDRNIWALGEGSNVCCWMGLQLSHLAPSLSFLSFSSEAPETDSLRQCVLSWRCKQRQLPGFLHTTFTGVIADVFIFNLLSWFHSPTVVGSLWNKASSWCTRCFSSALSLVCSDVDCFTLVKRGTTWAEMFLFANKRNSYFTGRQNKGEFVG